MKKGGQRTMFQFDMRRLGNSAGFTLIELLIVVAIIAILAAILIPNFLRARAQSQVAASKCNLQNVATALDSYYTLSLHDALPIYNLIPNYTRALPKDPCSGSDFGTSPGYTYTAVGNPATDYTLRTNWSAADTGAPCYSANTNANIQYTPGGGLQSTP